MKAEKIKKIIRRLHAGEDVEIIKKELFEVDPLQIPFAEQALVAEGVPLEDILNLCDLHVELFRDSLRGGLRVPKGHPLDLLLRENEFIVTRAEALALSGGASETVLQELRGIRLHYRKLQMLVFPYLERFGLHAIPRVLWGKEDQVIRGLRKLREKENPDLAKRLSREIMDIVFRENRILYPALWELLEDPEWRVIYEIGRKIGFLVDVEEEWKTEAEPRYPFELDPEEVRKRLERLPDALAGQLAQEIMPDNYEIRKENDLKLETGFLNTGEIEGIFSSLPLEITFANADRRVRFFSSIGKGFLRTKTIIGRRLEYCHPPRLENYVRMHVERIEKGELESKTFWTRMGDRTIRVIISAVRDNESNYLGVLEVVEDLTEVVKNPEEVKKRIMIL